MTPMSEATEAATMDWTKPEGLEVVTSDAVYPLAWACPPEAGWRLCYWPTRDGRQLITAHFNTKTGAAHGQLRIRPASPAADAVKDDGVDYADPATGGYAPGTHGKSSADLLRAEVDGLRETFVPTAAEPVEGVTLWDHPCQAHDDEGGGAEIQIDGVLAGYILPDGEIVVPRLHDRGFVSPLTSKRMKKFRKDLADFRDRIRQERTAAKSAQPAVKEEPVRCECGCGKLYVPDKPAATLEERIRYAIRETLSGHVHGDLTDLCDRAAAKVVGVLEREKEPIAAGEKRPNAFADALEHEARSIADDANKLARVFGESVGVKRDIAISIALDIVARIARETSATV